MLNAQSDRVDYRELLSPPPNYKVAFAVGTTYSLDLETLTATCAIIGLNVEADTGIKEKPLYMLEAIRKASGRLLVFCQSGQIKTPDTPNRLMSLLENCVCEVSLPNKRSFHPKSWFIRYTADKLPERYRLIVMSRNFTFDRSWDVAIRLDSAAKGEPAITQGDGSMAIKTFLQWLNKNLKTHNEQLKGKRKLLINLADKMAEVKWKQFGKGYDSFGFIPYGIGLQPSDNLNDTFHKLFVISPFISKSIFEGYLSRRLANPDCTLITRKSELSKLNCELLTAFDTYTVKDDVVDGEERISESGDFMAQDIHAKVYLRTKSSDSELYIGSANATYNAFYGGNVECMVVLRGKQRYLNVDRLKQDLFGSDEKANPFEKVEPKNYTASEEDAVLRMLESAVREFCAIRKTAAVTGKETYEVAVTMKSPQSDAKITLSPLLKKNFQPIGEKMVFSGFALRDLSEWYVMTVKSRGREISRVVKIPTIGIPESRDSAVFGDIVRDKNEFLTYIAFLLSDDYLSAFLEGMKNGKDDFRFLNMNFDEPILYERMLKAAASSPESLREVRDIIRLANANIIPPDFLKLYEQFEKVICK